MLPKQKNHRLLHRPVESAAESGGTLTKPIHLPPF
jgi:hypothetical protein